MFLTILLTLIKILKQKYIVFVNVILVLEILLIGHLYEESFTVKINTTHFTDLSFLL